jgi:hypothetical protein
LKLSVADKNILSDENKEAVMDKMQEIIYAEDEKIVKNSAVNVINQFKRFFDTKDCNT